MKIFSASRRGLARTAVLGAVLAASLAASLAAVLSTATTASAATPTHAITPATTSSASSAAASSSAYDFYAGYLNPGAGGTYCFHFGNYANVGPVAVSATASEYNVIVRTVSTALETISGKGYAYCATILNTSTTTATGATIHARGNLTSGYFHSAAFTQLAPGTTARYCFQYNNESYEGPIVVNALPANPDVVLTTVSTDLEDRANYGWTYCASIKNSSSHSTGNLVVMAQSALSDTSYANGYVGYLAAGATGRYCFNAPATSWPVAVTARASDYATILTTLSTDWENRLNYGTVYCATIKNSSTTGSGVTLEGRDGF